MICRLMALPQTRAIATVIAWLGLVLVSVTPAFAQSAPSIEVEGLMPNTAILLINGERKMLKVGQTHNGVTLVQAYSKTATLKVDGKQMVVGLSRRVGSVYKKSATRDVRIQRDAQLQYRTTAQINGRRLQVLVDTGANVMALSSKHAQLLGIDHYKGVPVSVETAGGIVAAWTVTLNSVDVGGIRVNSVAATVLEGDFPNTVLLGMTYLKHVKMQENQGVITLTQLR